MLTERCGWQGEIGWGRTPSWAGKIGTRRMLGFLILYIPILLPTKASNCVKVYAFSLFSTRQCLYLPYPLTIMHASVITSSCHPSDPVGTLFTRYTMGVALRVNKLISSHFREHFIVCWGLFITRWSCKTGLYSTEDVSVLKSRKTVRTHDEISRNYFNL